MYIPILIKHLQKPLYRNAVYILLSNTLPGVLGIVFWGAASRLYRPDEVGLGAAILSGIVLVSGMAGLGTFAGVIRFLPEARDPEIFLNSLYTLILLTSVISGIVFLIGIPFWTPKLEILRTNRNYLLVFLLGIGITPLSTLVMHSFIALRHSHYATLFVMIANALRLLSVVIFFRQGAMGIVNSVTLGLLVALIILLGVYLPRIIPGYHFRWRWGVRLYKAILPYSIGNYFVSLLAQSAQTVLPILILEILGPQANGFAYIPLQLSFTASSFGFSLATSAFAESAHHLPEAYQIVTRSLAASLVISLVLTLVMLIGAPVTMAWFGVEYARESTGLLRLASLAGPFMVLNQNYYTLLRLEKRIGQLILLSLACFTLTVGVAYFLMPAHGIQASGIGLLVGHASVSIFILILTRSRAVTFIGRDSGVGNEAG